METKTCPHCKQEIPADSLKCHLCREWLDWKRPAKRAVGIIVAMVVLWGGFMLVMDRFTDRVMFREAKYWQQPDAITITSHRAGQNDEGGLCVIGTMKNVSETPWRSITIQVDYYDSKGQLVDTSEDWVGETLPPGQQRSFKVVFKTKRAGVEYDHYKVFIAGADDASRF